METIIIAALRFLLVQYNGFLKIIQLRGRNSFKSKNINQLCDQHFIEAKVFYMKLFNIVPCVAYISNVDTKNVFELIEDEKYGKVKDVYQRLYHDWKDDKIYFSKTIFVVENKLMVKLDDDWLEVYFATKDYAMANKMLNEFKLLKAPEKEKDYEINIISLSGTQLDLKTIAIKPTHLDIDLYYNDDFKIIDALIRERLAKENDKGIVLLHGLPGTGKTTYLRYLIGNLKKKVMFVSPSVAGN